MRRMTGNERHCANNEWHEELSGKGSGRDGRSCGPPALARRGTRPTGSGAARLADRPVALAVSVVAA